MAIADMERVISRKVCMGDGMAPERRDGSEEKNDDTAAITKPPTADQKDKTPAAD